MATDEDREFTKLVHKIKIVAAILEDLQKLYMAQTGRRLVV